MAGLSLNKVVSRLMGDIFAQTNLLSENGYQIALVPTGKIEKYNQIVDMFARELSDKLGKVLVIKVDHTENKSESQRREDFESLVDMEKDINQIYTTQIVRSPHEYNKMLVTQTSLQDFFKHFSAVLFQYDANIFEKNPKVFEIQKDVIALVNRKETPVDEIEHVKNMKERFDFNFIASIVV